MPIEKSAGVIIFRREGGEIHYLLLHYPGFRAETSHWDFPKGKIEKGEGLLETVKREVREETGIEEFEVVEGFKETIRYFFKWEGKNIMKFVTFFLAETKEREVKISWEHIGFKWLPYKEALKQTTHKNAKDILKKANDFLSKKGI